MEFLPVRLRLLILLVVMAHPLPALLEHVLHHQPNQSPDVLLVLRTQIPIVQSVAWAPVPLLVTLVVHLTEIRDLPTNTASPRYQER